MWLKGSEHELASVGDDYAVILWDSRKPGPATKIAGAHGKEDLHCVDWNPLDPDLLATGKNRLRVTSGHPAMRCSESPVSVTCNHI